ncbi:MAG TPA: dTDP-glucose 4,6-dehydratase [bacterium]|nr:dTDP-glucose 4,6-dehydratase [bacterium]HPQ17661.1 dTDP-glucose 4,6-dehydratase [bacterium]
MKRTILVTGGAGFIGSNFIHYMLNKYEDIRIINYDKLTYAGNLDNLKDIENHRNYKFYKGDIVDKKRVAEIVQKEKVNEIINFAAETHVDRSIGNPEDFIITDVVGTYTLLEITKEYKLDLFIQISTDEVYGSIETGFSKETDTLKPSNPYSASKCGADRLAYSYFVTYKLPVIITRASNNFGPYQYPEKFLPLFITNALDNKKLPLYGDGLNVRDWLFVLDHCDAIDYLRVNGKFGEVYNIGGENLKTNLEMVKLILQKLNKSEDLIMFVQDRPGHDRRYALDISKLKNLGWKHNYSFDNAFDYTIKWYKENEWWWRKIKTGEYLKYYKKHYKIEL